MEWNERVVPPFTGVCQQLTMCVPVGKVRVWSWRVCLTAFPEQQTRPESR